MPQICIFLYRLNYFPPSFKESQETRVCPDASPEFMVIVDSTNMAMSLAPPVYSQDSSEVKPPLYSEAETIQQGQMNAEEPREISSGRWGRNSFCLTGWEGGKNWGMQIVEVARFPHQAEWGSSGNVLCHWIAQVPEDGQQGCADIIFLPWSYSLLSVM